MKSLCALALATVLSSSGAENPNDKTFDLDNGRFWNTLTPGMRHAYMRGLFDGWQLRGNTEELAKGSVIERSQPAETSPLTMLLKWYRPSMAIARILVCRLDGLPLHHSQ